MLNWQVRFTRNQNHLVTLIRNQISGPIGNFIRLNTSHTWSGHVDCQYLVAVCCCIFLTHLSISRVRFSEDPQDITGAQQVPNTKGWTTQEEIGLVGRLEANGHARGWDERSWCSRALHTVNARGSSTLRHQKFTNPLLGGTSDIPAYQWIYQLWSLQGFSVGFGSGALQEPNLYSSMSATALSIMAVPTLHRIASADVPRRRGVTFHADSARPRLAAVRQEVLRDSTWRWLRQGSKMIEGKWSHHPPLLLEMHNVLKFEFPFLVITILVGGFNPSEKY